MYASRVRGRHILFENLARASKASKEREERKARRLANRAKRDAAALLPRDSRRNGPWRLHQEETKFNLFLPLHQLWLGYMSELLALAPAPSAPIPDADKSAAPNAAGMHAKLVKADFHGSLMTVRRSKNPCMVGLSGIVVHETENAFKLITKKDQLKLVPKQNSIFSFSVPLYSTEPSGRGSPSETQTVLDIPHIEFELYGNQFRFRAAERAGRKFKHKETIEL
ncbi:RNase P subunit p29-like protein [Wolfiporia cocos MD-104 SS10]|uniref:Ribonuclease P protein subunit n=1 Tax=Wolfiporia cocos (strain MD-104) TaxID=742152 RepID=A0A2H3J8I2_WOLCO|nr:RNase P subunit p29-like protein [Wolfiporia cocos MD-104 SS10]